jgi:hypothetical protein
MFNLGSSTGRVHISGPGGAPGIVGYANSGNRRDIRFDDTGISLLTSDTSAIADDGLTIDEDGNVGIGASPPLYPLDVRTSDQGPAVYAASTNTVLATGVAASATGTGNPDADAVAGSFLGSGNDFVYGVSAEGHTEGGTAYGVYARGLTWNSSGTTTYGIYADVMDSAAPTKYAGWFAGDVHVTGTISTDATKPFRIDHPLDPENKYLYHYAMESPEVLNLYRGTVVLDTRGEGWAELPSYFQNISRDFTYQLTPVGAPMPNLHVAREIDAARFKIAGGKAGMNVSWQVTALRNDAYVREYGAPVEVEKPEAERGFNQRPERYGQPEERGVNYRHRVNANECQPSPLRQPEEPATDALQDIEDADLSPQLTNRETLVNHELTGWKGGAR